MRIKTRTSLKRVRSTVSLVAAAASAAVSPASPEENGGLLLNQSSRLKPPIADEPPPVSLAEESAWVPLRSRDRSARVVSMKMIDATMPTAIKKPAVAISISVRIAVAARSRACIHWLPGSLAAFIDLTGWMWNVSPRKALLRRRLVWRKG